MTHYGFNNPFAYVSKKNYYAYNIGENTQDIFMVHYSNSISVKGP